MLDVFRQAPTARNLHAYEQSLEEASLVVNAAPAAGCSTPSSSSSPMPARRPLSGATAGSSIARACATRPSGQTGAPGGDAADPLPAIQSFRDQLQARGIRLLVVPVPNKESIYPEKLSRPGRGRGSHRLRADASSARSVASSAASSSSTCSRNSAAPSRTQSRSDPMPLYLAQDSHWSPEGARLAAAAVARRVLERGLGQAAVTVDYDARPVPSSGSAT